jgi:hypothetical protein
VSRVLLRLSLLVALASTCATVCAAQAPPSPRDSSRKFEITDNSFLVEESFNQEAGVFQNIFTWTRTRNGGWESAFTQEWPLGGMTHQFSYTVPFSGADGVSGVNDVLLNYRYQLLTETAARPALSPRLSVVLPTGREADGLGSGVVGLQVNVPASKQFGDLYVHANAGFTWLPAVTVAPNGATRTLTSPQFAVGGIWRVAPMLNLMLEVVAEFDDTAAPQPARERTITASPGFRTGWNIGPRQVVVGAAMPVSRVAGRSDIGVITYFSYELPFR